MLIISSVRNQTRRTHNHARYSPSSHRHTLLAVVIAVFLGYLVGSADGMVRCSRKKKQISCWDIANIEQYYSALSEQEFDARIYKEHEQLGIYSHPFSGSLESKLFNFTRSKSGKQVRFEFLRLKELTVSDGRLADVEPGAFRMFCPYLSKLDLSMNRLTRIPLDALRCDKSNLKSLNLSGNVIGMLDSVYPLSALEVLDLSNNSIETINRDAFGFGHRNLSKLRLLYLNHNYLKQLDATTFMRLPSSSGLKMFLEDNQLQCDCYLRWLTEWPQPDNSFQLLGDGPVCFSPNTHRMMPLISLSQTDFVCEPVISASVSSSISRRVASSSSGLVNRADSAQSLVVYEGSKIVLVCSVFADPRPDVWWTFKDAVTIGKTLSDRMHEYRYSVQMKEWDERGLNVTSTLTIEQIQMADAGDMRCVAAIRLSNPASSVRWGNETSELFHLVVRQKHHRVDGVGMWLLVVVMFVSVATVAFLATLCWRRWNRKPKNVDWNEDEQDDKGDEWNAVSKNHVAAMGTDGSNPVTTIANGSNNAMSPLLKLGPPMYQTGTIGGYGFSDQCSVDRYPHCMHPMNGGVHGLSSPVHHHHRQQHVPSVASALDDFDMSGYEENYQPFANDIRSPGQPTDDHTPVHSIYNNSITPSDGYKFSETEL